MTVSDGVDKSITCILTKEREKVANGDQSARSTSLLSIMITVSLSYNACHAYNIIMIVHVHVYRCLGLSPISMSLSTREKSISILDSYVMAHIHAVVPGANLHQ